MREGRRQGSFSFRRPARKLEYTSHVAESRRFINATKVERCPRRARKVSGRQVSAGEERTRGTDAREEQRERRIGLPGG